jgi:membrane protease subunit HflC
MNGIWETHKASIMALVALLFVAWITIIPVSETQQAVITRGGEPVRIYNQYNPKQPFGSTGAGLSWRIPFVEQVKYVNRQVLDLDMQPQLVLSSDKQRLEVDAYARFRIINPVLMVQSAGDESNLETQLSPILSSVLRQELGRHSFASLLTAERGNAMINIRNALDKEARQYGAQVIDVRIKRADLPAGSPLETAFVRMQTDRQAEAETIRAQGSKDAQIIQAEAEAKAAEIYAAAYGKDPQFYDFYRAMESYRKTFMAGTGQSAIIMSPDNEYLRQFRGSR